MNTRRIAVAALALSMSLAASTAIQAALLPEFGGNVAITVQEIARDIKAGTIETNVLVARIDKAIQEIDALLNVGTADNKELLSARAKLTKARAKLVGEREQFVVLQEGVDSEITLTQATTHDGTIGTDGFTNGDFSLNTQQSTPGNIGGTGTSGTGTGTGGVEGLVTLGAVTAVATTTGSDNPGLIDYTIVPAAN